MSPDDKTKPWQSQKWSQMKFRIRRGLHWTQVKRGWDQLQASLPRDLGQAIFQSLALEGKDLIQEIYKGDLLAIGQAAKNGDLSPNAFLNGRLSAFHPNYLKNKSPSPIGKFFNQMSSDLSNCPSAQDKAGYLVKVLLLFASAGIGATTAINVATFSFGTRKASGRPWIPSLGLVVGSSVLARLLDHSIEHIPESSKDRALADFLKANFEIIAFGGSLGILEIPDFVNQAVSDPVLNNVKAFIHEMMAEDISSPRPLIGVKG